VDITDKMFSAHIMASSYLNAVYSYLSWKHPMEQDEKAFQDALNTVKKHHDIQLNEYVSKIEQALRKQSEKP
jgi:hypothetical protein